MAAGMKILENCKYILIGDRYGISEGMKAEMTFAAVKGKILSVPAIQAACLLPVC